MASPNKIYPTTSKFERLIIFSGIARAKLAKRVGVSGAAVTYWCQGSNKPRIDTLLKLADHFNLTPNQMLSYFLTPSQCNTPKNASAADTK